MTILLSNDDVAKLLTVAECMAVMEGAYAELASGKGLNRVRSDTIIAHPTRKDAVYSLKSMDGVVPSLGVGAVRINSDVITWPMVGNSQRRKKVPAAGGRWVGLVLLFSTETGEPLAIMPDGVMQRIRVAAANGLAAKHMAREDACDVALIGSGWQAGTQVEAICAVRPVKRIRVYSPNGEHRAAFAAATSPLVGIEIEPVSSAEAAVAGADVVLCATSSIDPVYFERWVRPGVHLSSIKTPEIEVPAIRRAQHVVLHVQDEKAIHVVQHDIAIAAAREDKASGVIEGLDLGVLPTLPELIMGTVKGRTRPEDVTVFLNNLGLGYQFAAAGAAVYAKAKEQGVGREFPTDWFTEDVHP